MLSLYPEHRSSNRLLKEITVDKLIKEIGGKPNFEIADIKNNVVRRENVTYTNPILPESVYFAIKINNKELKGKIIEVLSNVDWEKEINNTAMPSIKIHHIVDVLKKYIPDIS